MRASVCAGVHAVVRSCFRAHVESLHAFTKLNNILHNN